jgi:sodium-dependent dicarboxylate transporter 2/3/5
MLLLTWGYLTRFAYPCSKELLPEGRMVIDQALQRLGPISKQERRVLVIFLAVAAAWILRGLVPIEGLAMVGDSSIAILGALALFLIPSGVKRGEYLLDWGTAVKIPWDIIILFGGGFALAEGFSSSGLTQWLADQLTVLQNVSVITLMAMVVLLTVFLTELTSNTAVASLLLPVMGALAVSVGVHPLATMVAAAIAASFAFMLPVATPPNAIVFASRSVTIPQMAKAGFLLNLLGVLLITGFVVLLLPMVFGVDIQATLW